MMTPDDRPSLTKRTRSYVLLLGNARDVCDNDEESHREEDYLRQLE